LRRSDVLWGIGNRRYSRKRCHGHIDRYEDGKVQGWAAQRSSSEKVAIDLRINGKLSISAELADQFRGDLLDAGIGDGCHGFCIDTGDLPEGCLVELIATRTGELLSSLVVEPEQGQVPPRPAQSTEPDQDSVARALALHFDVDFYLQQFENSSLPEDPIRHYVESGWKDGLDPHPDFSTQHYLSMNADVRERGVNPYCHYVVAGRAERRPPKAVSSTKIERLRELRSLDSIKARWKRKEPPPEALSVDNISGDARIQAALGKSNVLLSISHDDHHKVAGGIQLCVRLEERKMHDLGQGHLAIHPWQPLPTMAEPESDGLVVLYAQGEQIGPVRLEDLGRVIARKTPRQHLSVAVHSLLGHEPEALSEFLGGIGPDRVLFWLHDHFTLCESYTLQRNTVSYCSAPDQTSSACGICIYGESRSTHLDRIAKFFKKTHPIAVAPSSFQLDFWKSKSNLPRDGAFVHPLARLAPTAKPSSAPLADGPHLRIAFVGWPADFKGWETFCELVSQGRSSGVEFHYFGTAHILQEGIVTHHVDVSPDRPDAAIKALWDSGVDIVVHWAGWPETFSFTAHEALAADTLVVTSAVSGNIAFLATQDPRIFVLPDTETLHREVLSGKIAALALARRKNRTLSELTYSGASADLVLAAVEQA